MLEDEILQAARAYLVAMGQTTDPLPLDDTRQRLETRRKWRDLMDRRDAVEVIVAALSQGDTVDHADLEKRLRVESCGLLEMAGSEAFTIHQRRLFETLGNQHREAAAALASLTKELEELDSLVPQNIASRNENEFWIREHDPVHGTVGRSMDSAEWSALTAQAWKLVARIVARREGISSAASSESGNVRQQEVDAERPTQRAPDTREDPA